MSIGRKKYVDKIVTCSVCRKDYTEILCENDLPDIVAFYCEEFTDKLKKEIEKRKTGKKSPRAIKQSG